MTTQATAMKTSAPAEVLYMALELANATWKVLFQSGAGRRRERTVPARDMAKLLAEIAAAKARLGLTPDAKVVSCYEAGRDGFWLHRALCHHGIENIVVDAASIEVARRAKHKKTDRIDLYKLMGLLLRWAAGEHKVWSVVRVPDTSAEDDRRLSRTLGDLKSERQRHRARMQSLLITEGIAVGTLGGKHWEQRVRAFRRWDATPLGEHLVECLLREGERLAFVEQQLKALKARREQLVATAPSRTAEVTRRLARLGAIAKESSFLFAAEFFGWRTFANRREVGGALGLTGTPYNSGDSTREQGISKAGNARMRPMMVEISWLWLRYQPRSDLSKWWNERFAKGGTRVRKIGIVALARKLAVALWHYLEHDVVPAGASLKPVPVHGGGRP